MRFEGRLGFDTMASGIGITIKFTTGATAGLSSGAVCGLSTELVLQQPASYFEATDFGWPR